MIPKDEIWVKIGGDKGGGSFKMAFQVGNLKNPNAKFNTIVYTAFEAPDNPYNIQVGLGRYTNDVKCLQENKWR